MADQPNKPVPAWPAHVPWQFHGIEGTKEELCATVNKSEAPETVKAYLCWLINSREGRAFSLGSAAAADHPGELTEHTRVRKIF